MPFVLLLEDDPMQIKIVTDLLECEAGLNVIATDSTHEALLLARQNPMLIICDICLVRPNFPTANINKDGIAFAKSVKSHKHTGHIPLILRSATPLSDFNTTFSETSANLFLNKSLSINQLLNVVKSFAHDYRHSDTLIS